LETSQTMTGSGRAQKILAIQSGNGKLAKNEALDISWSSSSSIPKLYAWESAFIIKPEDTDTRSTDPDDLGTLHAKWVQGFRIHANTFNVVKSFNVQSDTGTSGAWVTQQSFNLTSDGQSVQAFSFDNAFITHLIRITTSDSDPWELFSYEFVFNIEPELVEEYEGQQTSFGLSGFLHMKDLYISHMSTANLSLVWTLDGVAQSSITISHSGGLRAKTYVPIPAKKFKVAQPKITSSSGFRLYLGDSEVRVKSWGDTGSYNVVRPFGETHYDSGVRI